MYVLPLEILEGRSPSEAASSEAASSERPPRNPSLLATALGGGLLGGKDPATLPLGLVHTLDEVIKVLGDGVIELLGGGGIELVRRGTPLGCEGGSGGALFFAFTLGRAGTA